MKRLFIVQFFLIFLFTSTHLHAQDSLLYPSLQRGAIAPAIKGKNEKGKTIHLAKIKSRYTLLYFYEVHCHLCELITPELKRLYDSYHPLGLEVLAIPTSSTRQEWKEYISRYSLNWINLFPEGNNLENIRSAYLLTASPTIYLLDRKKIILTQRLGRAEQVEEELNSRIR